MYILYLMALPGAGALYLGQTLKFVKPVFVGDTIYVEVTVTEIRKEKKIFTASTIIRNQDGQEVVTGEATMMAGIV
jgi:acyl dehydratase